MNYEQFKEYVKESMEAVTGEKVEICPVVKNNSVVYDGLSVCPDDACTAVPTIYLGKYYDSYRHGVPASELVRDMVAFYETKKRKLGIDLSIFREFSGIQGKVGFKLINRSQNRKLLERVPHRPFLDLEIVYYLLFLGSFEGDATMLIENEHMKIWGITPEELHKAAMNNMEELLPATFRGMDLVMRDIYQEELKSALLQGMDGTSGFESDVNVDMIVSELITSVELRQKTMPMYVVSNKKNLFGASAILYSDYLEEWAEELECDLYVIPSSVHELLVMPAAHAYSGEEITEMIREINRTQVAREEILSDHVYIYRRNEGRITM